MPIQQGLQHHHHVGLGDPRGGLHHHRLVELLNRAVHVVQPAHDRSGRHRPDTLIDQAGLAVGDPGDPGQSGHGLLDEDVARATHHTGRPGPRHHLHRQDAVPAQFEERVVDPDPLEPEDLGVDAGQDLLDGVGRGAVVIGVLVFGCGQGAGVEFAVGASAAARPGRRPRPGTM